MVERILYDSDEDRCAYITLNKQCTNRRLEGSEYCQQHDKGNLAAKKKKQSYQNYQLSRFKAQLGAKLESSALKTLVEEIAILRMLIQTRMNQCKDEYELVTASGPLSELILKVEKVVSSCHKLEEKMGNHLDKQQILQFASGVVGIINEEIGDEKVVSKISDAIIKLIGDKTEG